MGYFADEADAAISSGQLKAMGFGTSFLANPDLPARPHIQATTTSEQVGRKRFLHVWAPKVTQTIPRYNRYTLVRR